MAILGAATRSFNPLWSFVDLNGKQFDDTFYMWVLQNQIPYAPATVWHDPAMTTPWTDPIQFLANGTLPLDIYWDPTQVYRLEFRQNTIPPPTQADALIYLVDNYIPSSGMSSTPTATGIYTDNQITNPQFAVVNFPQTFTLVGITNPGSINFAPGWFLEGLVGTGNVTIVQTPLSSTVPTPTNASFAIHITIGGTFTGNPILRQRFQANGVNWANKFVSGSITAMSTTVGALIQSRIDTSMGAPIAFIIGQTPTPLTGTFAEYKGVAQFPASTNTDVPPNAWLDYKILLSNNIDIYLTSVQIIASDTPNQYEYEETAVNRQIDHTFNYYQAPLNYKPTSSYLVGWDFPLNPAQVYGATRAAQNFGANSSMYVWDQTIVFQSVTSGVSISRDANNGLLLTAAQNGQVALLQYLGPLEARKIFSDRASVHISASTTHAGGLTGTVTLWACSSANLPNVADGTNLSAITALSASGVPTMGNGTTWTQMPNLYQNNTFTLQAASATNSESADIYLNGWDFQGNAISNTATFFAIVVGFAPWITTDTITANSISVCPGDIATRPAPKTLSETLLNCQRFYYKTFQNATVPAQNVGQQTGEFMYPATVTGASTMYSPILEFPTTMRATPTIISYNPNAANVQVLDESAAGSTSGFATYNLTAKGVVIRCVGVAGGGGTVPGNAMGVHITADARYGIV